MQRASFQFCQFSFFPFQARLHATQKQGLAPLIIPAVADYLCITSPAGSLAGGETTAGNPNAMHRMRGRQDWEVAQQSTGILLQVLIVYMQKTETSFLPCQARQAEKHGCRETLLGRLAIKVKARL